MNSIQLAIERERHHIALFGQFRPEEAARCEARIKILAAELADLRREEAEILERHEVATRAPRQDTPVLNPMGADEWVDRQWIRDEQNQSKRPR